MKRGRWLQRLAAAGLGVLAIALLWYPARACANFYHKEIFTMTENLHGEARKVSELTARAYVEQIEGHGNDREVWRARQKNLLKRLDAAPGDFKLRADLAAVDLFLGQVSQAVAEFEKLEAEKPGEYIIAGNLGTAYELSGQNAKALEWIKKGIERNPYAHDGTEWLHAKILEAKLAIEKDPRWLDTHSVLGLDFGPDPEPAIPQNGPVDHLGKTRSIGETVRALEYQLHERTALVGPTDAVVGDLLHDLACLVAQEQTVLHARAVMELAMAYAPDNTGRLSRRLGFFSKRADEVTREVVAGGRKNSGLWESWIAMTVGAGALTVLTLFIIARRLRRLAY